ncbi:MAG: rhomboid family intramembrane serine protease [Leptolyngbyaceae cyanobacterium bins.349]|nr:rhomboid family intramembrane serine protease [Leptolyngbyaceae cyanobacterium bins.349]
MNLNLFLIQLVLITSVLMLTQARRLPRGWLIVNVLILIVLGGSLILWPEWAGWISGGVWLVVFLLPLLGSGRVNRLVSQERYHAARQLAFWVKWLHPADGMVEYPQLLRGLALGQQGKFAAARQLLSRYQTDVTSTGRAATVMLYRMHADWAGIRRWVEQRVPEKVLDREIGLALVYLRSLGELGDLNGLLQGAERLEQRLGRSSNPLLLNTVRLYALAFCGQVESVKRLLEQMLSVYPRQTHQFWIATAEWAAGRHAIARELLTSLSQTEDAALQNAINGRLAAPPLDPIQVLTEPSHRILNQIKTAIAQESRYSSWNAVAARKSYATYGLIGINVLVFAVSSRLGGNEDLYVLYRLGALVPEAVVTGEWWRCLTAIFLHSGLLHLSANMLGLYVFGALVESALGLRLFLACYFFCGIGSMLTVTLIAITTPALPQITVGASGAVLGMVGAEAAIQLKGWRLEKAKIARERLQLISLVVVFQLVSDLLTPQVSIIGHISGTILGFLAGLVLFKPSRRSG